MAARSLTEVAALRMQKAAQGGKHLTGISVARESQEWAGRQREGDKDAVPWQVARWL